MFGVQNRVWPYQTLRTCGVSSRTGSTTTAEQQRDSSWRLEKHGGNHSWRLEKGRAYLLVKQ